MQRLALPRLVFTSLTNIGTMALVSFVRARLEILELNLRTGLARDSEKYNKLASEAVGAMTKMTAGIKELKASDLSVLLQMIEKAPLSDEKLAELRDSWNEKLDAMAVGVAVATQAVEASESYYSKPHWDALLDEKVTDVNHTLAFVAGHWATLGLSRISETTAKDVAAVALLKQPDYVVGGPIGIDYVRTFKKLLKTMQPRDGADGPLLMRFPLSPLELRESEGYKRAFHDGDPIPCPIEIYCRYKHVQAVLGCRSSKTGCGAASRRGNQQSNPLEMLQMMLLQQQQQQVRGEQPLRGLQIFRPGQQQQFREQQALPAGDLVETPPRVEPGGLLAIGWSPNSSQATLQRQCQSS